MPLITAVKWVWSGCIPSVSRISAWPEDQRETELNKPDEWPVIVRTPSGVWLRCHGRGTRSAALPAGRAVIKRSSGIFDTFPLSLITTRSLVGLGARVGARFDLQRLRANILLQTVDAPPFVEETRVGCVLRVGGMGV